MKLTILGLGEAGSLIARGLAAQGVEVVGFDPVKQKFPVVTVLDSAEEAVADADVVFSLNSSTVSVKVARQVAEHLKPGAIFCDLNTGTPSLKKNLAGIIPAGSFVDVAVMKPVPGLAEKVPLSVAGEGASKFMKLFGDLDMDISYVSDVAGDAAARKLLRSILAKGMASIVIDTLWAAKELGLEDWAMEEINREFDTNSSKTVTRYLDGTQQHAKRRSVEMADVLEMLTDAGYESTVVRGIELTLSRVIHGVRIPFAKFD
jgi:3-hydroxyisobutyrate dehydrogenase-like beta-hydroxyacid dehydrogenase